MMRQLNEVKKNMFEVMRTAVKFSSNFQGKGTILENKTVEYKMQLLENLDNKSTNFKKLSTESPDFNLLLSKSRKVLVDLQSGNYSDGVRRYVSDVAYMFENDLKSIAKVIVEEKIIEKKEEIKLKSKNLSCKCGKMQITNEDIIQFRLIKKNQEIKCDKCKDTIIVLLTADDNLKELIKKSKKEEDKLDMSSLKLITEI